MSRDEPGGNLRPPAERRQPAGHNRAGDTVERAGRSSESRRPAMSFLLLAFTIVVAAAGAITWALVRPEPRAIEIILPTPGPIVVHVTGAVTSPGVYSLDPGSRVSDAVVAAGGLTAESSVNMAGILVDGQQLVVPGPRPPALASDPASPSNSEAAEPRLLDLNTATVEELVRLPGIGPSRAESIISFRERSGPILFADDLVAVDGIGVATVEGIRPLVTQQ